MPKKADDSGSGEKPKRKKTKASDKPPERKATTGAVGKRRSKKPGPPKREFDHELFEDCCHIHCTVEEIEALMRADIQTIYDWVERHYGEKFSKVREHYMSGGKRSLRRAQLDQAQRNPSMAIWLGKNWLKQKDNKDEERPQVVQYVSALSIKQMGKSDKDIDANQED